MRSRTKEVKTLEKMLNLPSVIIKGYHEFEGIGWIFEIESASKESRCPRCGKKSRKLHKNHGHLVKDLAICGRETYLKVNRRQYFFPILKKMYAFKERFRIIYELSDSWQEGILKIATWLKQVKNLFPQSSKTIKNWIGKIISYFDHRTTQGVVEGINNKLKLIKRTAYGFRNFDNFCTRVFLNWHFQC